MPSRTIRILLLGDQHVGKSSFISSLIGQKLPKYQKCFQPVLLPPSMCHGTKDVRTQLFDSNTDDQKKLQQQILRAQLILLFYDTTDEMTVTRLTKYWMPLISKVRDTVPIIVVGNKMDKKEGGAMPYTATIKEVLKPIIRKYRQVEMGLECSAMLSKGVGSVLSCAQRAVLYPLTPLYDLPSKDLTPPFKRILVRIFRLLDRDGDGLLSDKQILDLQTRVFDSNLQIDDLKRLKQIIKVQLEQQDMNSITLDGFFTLNKKCIQMLAIHICWSILRYYNYSDTLKLHPTFQRFSFSSFSGCSTQLKQKPINFLKRLYQYCSRGLEKQRTSHRLMCEIFYPESTIPLEFARKQRMELLEFIFEWNYLAYSNYLQCYKILRGIGYEGDLETTFVLREQKVSLKEMGYVQRRNIISIGVYDGRGGREVERYVEGVFAGRTVEDQGVRRASYIYSLAHGSKIFYLFRLDAGNIQKFFYHHSRMLDIFVYFQQDHKTPPNDKTIQSAPQWTMVKQITQKQSQSIGVLDRTKKPDYNKLFDLIWSVIKYPSTGYSELNLKRMKMLNDKTLFDRRNLEIMGGYAVALGICGYLIANKNSK